MREESTRRKIPFKSRRDKNCIPTRVALRRFMLAIAKRENFLFLSVFLFILFSIFFSSFLLRT